MSIGTLLFHPKQAELDGLHRLGDWGGQVLCFNNGPKGLETKLPDNLVVLGDGAANRGVSVGINHILKTAFENERCQFVLFLDQDSIVNIAVLKANWHKIAARLEERIVLRLSESNAETLDIRPTRLLINSGTIFTRKAWTEIGGLDERYFVDGADYDYSLRLHTAGFALYTVGIKGLFNHTTLQAGRAISLLGKRIWIRNYGNRHKSIFSGLIRLIADAIARGEPEYAWIFTRSLAISTLGHLVSVIFASRDTERTKQ